jgi:hypothetical protein
MMKVFVGIVCIIALVLAALMLYLDNAQPHIPAKIQHYLVAVEAMPLRIEDNGYFKSWANGMQRVYWVLCRQYGRLRWFTFDSDFSYTAEIPAEEEDLQRPLVFWK